MAIYSGNWKDGAGVPFDPNAFAHGQQGAKVAQPRRRGRRDQPHIARNTATARYLAHVWLNVLTDAQRTEWGRSLPCQGFPRDPDRGISYVTPFLGFAVENWLPVYLGGDYQDEWPQIPGLSILNFAVIECWPRWLSFGFTVPNLPAQYEWTQISVYHINPARSNSSIKFRMTRNIHFEVLEPLSPGYKTRLVPLPWFQPYETTAWFLFRVRTAYTYDSTFYQSIYVPFPP